MGRDVGAVSILDAVAQKAEGLGGVVVGAGKALAGLAAVGAGAVVAGMGAAVTSAAGFEQQMSEVKAVSGATGEEMKSLSGLALQLGKDTSFSASEAAAGITELVKGGLSVPDIMHGAAEATLNLAAAGGISLPDAATIAANALAQFNLKGEDMAHVADLIAGAANASALDVGQFKQSLQAAGAVAATVGFSFDDLAQGIAIMGKAGITGSDAGTSLKTMMLNLQPQTKEQIGLMTQLGLITADGANKFFDATGKVKSMAEVAGILQNATKGLTEQQKLAALQTLFGSDAVRAAAVLAKEGAGGFTEMAGAMGKVSAAAVGAEKLNNVKGSIQQLQGSAETLAITFGTALLPVFKRGLDGATSFVNGLIPLADKLGNQIATGAQQGGAALTAFLDGDVLKAGAILKTAFNIDALPFLTGLDAIKQAVGSLLSGDLPKTAAIIGQAFGIDLTPFFGILQGAQNAVMFFVNEIQKNFYTVVGIVKQALSGDVTGALQGFLGMFVDGRVKLVETLLGWGQAFLGWLLPQVPKLLAQLTTFLQSMLTWLGGAVVQVVEHLAPMAAAFIDWVGPQLPGLLRELGAFAAGMFEWLLGTALPAIREKLGQWGMAFFEWIGPRIGPMLLEVGKLLGELTIWLGTTGIPAIQKELAKWGDAFLGFIAKDVLPFLADKLKELLTAMGEWIIETAIPAVTKMFVDLGAAILTGIVDGLKRGAHALFDYLLNLAKKAISSAIGAIFNRAESSGGAAASAGASGSDSGGGSSGAQSETRASAFRSGLASFEPAARTLALPAARAAGRGGDTVINLQVNGSVVTEKDLVNTVWQGLLAKQRRDATLGFSNG